MSKPAIPADTGRGRGLFIAFACYLIATFLYRALTPAHEYPRFPERPMTVSFDILATIGLFGLRAQGAKPLLWIGVAAGIGLLLIRLNGPDSWATGHLMYWLTPR
jgi:hypothetical protein